MGRRLRVLLAGAGTAILTLSGSIWHVWNGHDYSYYSGGWRGWIYYPGT